MVARNESGRVAVSHDDPSARPSAYSQIVANQLETACIQMSGAAEGLKTFSVLEYEEKIAEARRLRTPAAQDAARLGWARFAPSVETLSDPPEPGFLAPRFQVVDREAYDLQMRQLLGIL